MPGCFPGQEESGRETKDVRTLVSRLDLEQYKATLKGLTQFGERRQGTKRNRDAVDWIEAQLKAVGCTSTARIDYVFDPPPRARRRRPARELNPTDGTPTGGRIGRNGSGPGGSSIFGYRGRTGSEQRRDGAAGRGAPRAQPGAGDERPAPRSLLHQSRDDPS